MGRAIWTQIDRFLDENAWWLAWGAGAGVIMWECQHLL